MCNVGGGQVASKKIKCRVEYRWVLQHESVLRIECPPRIRSRGRGIEYLLIYLFNRSTLQSAVFFSSLAKQ
jgi:hypothetical protein